MMQSGSLIQKMLRLIRRARNRRLFRENLYAAHTKILQSLKFEKKILHRSQLFDADWYLRRYPDVAAARVDPLTHYVRAGAKEGRNPNPLFDGNWYLESYPDVAAAGANPLLHYVQHGDREGRDPHPSFSTRHYLERNPEVAETGLNSLAHYLRVGRETGRPAVHPNAQYASHVLKEQQQLAMELPELLRHIEIMMYRPMFHVYVDGADAELRARTVNSLERQIYQRWVVDDWDWQTIERAAVPQSDDVYIIFLSAGDMLNERALYEFADALNANPALDTVYGDEDLFDASELRSSPYYKPDWSPDTLESLNYIGPAACHSARQAAAAARDARCAYDFVLRVTERAADVGHVRVILCHRHQAADAPVSASQGSDDARALAGRLERTGRSGLVTPAVLGHGCYEVTVTTAEPLVSIIIPTAGQVATLGGRRVDLIFNCLDAIERTSTYKNLELVVVDNGDLGDSRRAALLNRGCRMVTFTEPVFNVARKLNLGASVATGKMLLLLNDDIEPYTPDWIERHLDHFEKPHVGVVGAKLLYPDLTLQHVGVASNQGDPEHVRRMYPAADRGYFFSSCSARNFTAVTGACMMVRADVYRAVGGYSEALAVNYNDVDFCLKVRQAGLTVVYAPRAQLIHYESQSRVAAVDLGESAYFHERWAPELASDAYYNELNMQVLPGSFEVVHNPRWL